MNSWNAFQKSINTTEIYLIRIIIIVFCIIIPLEIHRYITETQSLTEKIIHTFAYYLLNAITEIIKKNPTRKL